MSILCGAKVKITLAEIKVLELMRHGLTNREIAMVLCRSEFTVKTHMQRILAKTGARNRTQACAGVSHTELTKMTFYEIP